MPPAPDSRVFWAPSLLVHRHRSRPWHAPSTVRRYDSTADALVLVPPVRRQFQPSWRLSTAYSLADTGEPGAGGRVCAVNRFLDARKGLAAADHSQEVHQQDLQRLMPKFRIGMCSLVPSPFAASGNCCNPETREPFAIPAPRVFLVVELEDGSTRGVFHMVACVYSETTCRREALSLRNILSQFGVAFLQQLLRPWRRAWAQCMASVASASFRYWSLYGWRAFCRFLVAGVAGRGRAGSCWRARFLAKAVFDLPARRGLVERLRLDATLRRLCGWPFHGSIPSEAKFSHAFEEFAVGELPERFRIECGWLQQARRDRPSCRSPPGVAARELGVGDDDMPARNGQPAYRVRVVITNIPAIGWGRHGRWRHSRCRRG